MPLISTSENWCFVHVPKTAGTSIYKALGFNIRNDLKVINKRHTPLHLSNIPLNMFTFGFTRNPYDRLVSIWWYFAHLTKGKKAKHSQDLKSLGFKKWLLLKPAYNHTTGWLGYQRTPSIWYLNNCDYIGKFESLSYDFANLCKTGKISPLAKLNYQPSQFITTTRKAHYREFYDIETREFVNTWFQKDITMFGYKF